MKKFLFFFLLFVGCGKQMTEINFVGKKLSEIEFENYQIMEEYHDTIPEGVIIKQEPQTIYDQNQEIILTVSKGPKPDYAKLKVNELGHVPIMMYHGIQDVESVSGNIDTDGYQRTKKAFIDDLEFYYKEGYRMIRLVDFVNGIVDVELGKSPMILTFDDGKNNIVIKEIDNQGNIIIDPNCAVGILESFKRKYPDYHVTATFFVNGSLFDDPNNELILKWLIEHDYDIGNHSYSHADFSKITYEKAEEEIGKQYALLNSIIENEYVSIVALPFGSPGTKDHPNFKAILDSQYNGKKYHTISTLRVGWEANISCFDLEFDPTFLKRIRAYDHNGTEFDIQMNFELLSKNRFISDGDKNQITVLHSELARVQKTDLKIVTYE